MNDSLHERKGLIFGLLIIAVGVLFLLDAQGYVTASYVFQNFWPVIFIYFGISNLLCRHPGPRTAWGVILVVIGSLLLLSNLGMLRVHFGFDTIWPLLIILAGVMMILRTFGRRAYEAQGDNASASNRTRFPHGPWSWMNPWMAQWGAADAQDAELNQVAVFGGIQQRFSVKNFKGGSVMAFCGGFEIDLTRAEIEGDTAVIDASCFMGGGEIKVPYTWRIDIRGVAILGAYADETHQEIPAAPESVKRLVVRGFATLGGVVIKN